MVAVVAFADAEQPALRGVGSARSKLWMLIVSGVVLILLGLAAGYTVCPIIKRIWTPSWVLWSGGIVILILAAFYSIMDIGGWKKWAFPRGVPKTK